MKKLSKFRWFIVDVALFFADKFLRHRKGKR